MDFLVSFQKTETLVMGNFCPFVFGLFVFVYKCICICNCIWRNRYLQQISPTAAQIFLIFLTLLLIFGQKFKKSKEKFPSLIRKSKKETLQKDFNLIITSNLANTYLTKLKRLRKVVCGLSSIISKNRNVSDGKFLPNYIHTWVNWWFNWVWNLDA